MAKISLVYLPIAFSGFTLLGVDQGRQRFVKYNLLKHLPTFFYALLLVGLAIMKSASIPFIVMGFLFSQLIATAILVASSGRELAPPRKGDRLACGRSILRQGLIYTMPALSGIILMRADLALLIPMVSARELGLYSAALAIAMGQNVLTSSIVQVNFPKVCAVGQAECSRIISRQLRKSIAPIILIALALAASSPLIIRYLLGSSFASAQNTTFVLIAAVMMWCIGQIIDNGLRGAGLGLPSTLAYIIGLLSLLAWAALLVPKYGALGMGVAFFLAQAAATAALIVALFRFVRKLRSAP
jgi:O-antigen/teichoic acid export membrane protein